MCRKFAFLALAVGALAWVAHRAHLTSYAGTWWSQVRTEAKNSVPTKFELERIRYEIASLDQDISQMIRPVAEYKAVIDRLRRDIAKGQSNLDDQRKVLLDVAKDLEENPKFVIYGGEKFPADRVRVRLGNDFESFKRIEKHLATQRQLLEAKEGSLKASQEQLAKVLEKKREFEIRLAELETREETMQIARIGSTPQIDSSRATQIEDALQQVEHRHSVETAALELRNNTIVGGPIPFANRSKTPIDVKTIRQHLEQGGGETTADNNR